VNNENPKLFTWPTQYSINYANKTKLDPIYAMNIVNSTGAVAHHCTMQGIYINQFYMNTIPADWRLGLWISLPVQSIPDPSSNGRFWPTLSLVPVGLILAAICIKTKTFQNRHWKYKSYTTHILGIENTEGNLISIGNQFQQHNTQHMVNWIFSSQFVTDCIS
jgi:hypothetical protein